MPVFLSGSLIITGSMTTSGTITAQTLVVQTITSSIVNLTGSNIFGSRLTDTQTFTGSVVMTGSLTVNTTGTEFQVTNNGVILGNLLADNHSMTGSLRITGSIVQSGANTTSSFTGNVGIGTSSPKTLLQINGGSGAYPTLGTNVTNSIFVGRNDGLIGMYLGYAADGNGWIQQMRNDSATAGNLILQPSGGAVNIGTTTNAYGLLAIKSNNTLTYGGINVYANGNDRFIALQHTGTLGVIETENAGSGVMTDMAFRTGGSERMRITSGGNVGIGTTTPAQTLEVSGNILASSTGKIGFRYSSTDGNYYSYLRSATAGNVGPIVLAGGFESGGGGNEAIRLVTNANPGERTVLSINNAGTSTFYGDTSLQGNNYINTAKMIQWEGGSYWSFRVISSAATFQLYQGSTGNTPITVDSAGRVSLSTPSTYALTVTNTTNTSGQGVFVTAMGSNNNNASSYHYIAATGGADKFYLFGNGTYQTVSDIRLKKNVTTVTDTYLDKLKDLRVVNYNWKDQEDGSPLEFGLIAQEVEEIIPSIVHEGREHENNIKYKGVQASVLPYILIKAIQELKAELDELKNK